MLTMTSFPVAASAVDVGERWWYRYANTADTVAVVAGEDANITHWKRGQLQAILSHKTTATVDTTPAVIADLCYVLSINNVSVNKTTWRQ